MLFILILTEFYMSAKRARSSIVMFAISLPAYVAAYWVAQTIWSGTELGYVVIISDSVGALVALVAHFFIVNFALGFYRQYLRLEKALFQ